jgi:4-hydroxymandelate oxidase
VDTLADIERLARERLPQTTWDYYAGGANDEIALRGNIDAWGRRALHYRVMVGVAERDLSATIGGHRVAMPLLVAPTAFHRLAHPDGELASVRAAGATGTIFVLSTLSNTAVEDVVAAATGPVWFQLYVYRDRGATEALIRRVEAAGCRALVVTVDAPLIGRRERDVRNRFTLPDDLRIENLHAGFDRLPASATDSGLAAYVSALLDPDLAWRDIGWLRSITKLPIWIKGVVRADDARRAIAEGAAGVIVSNHGGRQLDSAPATIDVLPAIADAIGNGGEILIDGGVRRGSDAIKAIALGAGGVLVGRPILWGLAAGGQAGVLRVLELLRDEIDLAMALCGCRDVAAIDRGLVSP